MSIIKKLKSIFNTLKLPAASIAFFGVSAYILGGTTSTIIITTEITFLITSFFQIARNYFKKQAIKRYFENKQTRIKALTQAQIAAFKIGVQSAYSTKAQLLSWFNLNVLLHLADYYAGLMAAQQEKNELIAEISQHKTKDLKLELNLTEQAMLTSLKDHGLFNIPWELISHTFQQIPLIENRQLRMVSKSFFIGWEHTAKSQLFTLSPAIQPLDIDHEFETLLNTQQAEIDYLTKNKAAIVQKNNQSPDLKRAFNKIANLEKNKSVMAYHIKETSLNTINEIIIRNIIIKDKNTLELHCCNCYLTRFPASILNDKGLCEFWKELKTLAIDFNHLSALPDDIKQLRTLQQLYINNNQLRSLPESIGQLSALNWFSVSSNQLSALPESIGQLHELRMLYVHSNQLSALPESIGQLNKLLVLDADNNQLSALPDAIIQCATLEQLFITQNYLSNLPNGLRNNILRSTNNIRISNSQCLAFQKEKPNEDNKAAADRSATKRQNLN